MVAITLRISLFLLILATGRNVFYQLAAMQVARLLPAPQGFQQALSWYPNDPEHHYGLGLLYRDQLSHNDLPAAQKHLEKATQLHPLNWMYWVELARAYELSGAAVEAENAYLKAIELTPRSALYWWRLANFYFRSGDQQKALLEFRKAVQLDPASYGEAAVSLLWKSGLREKEIEQVWPDNPQIGLRLLGILMKGGATADYLGKKWQQLMEGGAPPSIGQSYPYLTYLMNTNPNEAQRQWTILTTENGLTDPEFNEGENLVWNGKLELAITNSPLDWALRNRNGYKVRTVDRAGIDDTRAIRIDFDGTENLTSVDVQQQLVVRPNLQYELSFFARCENLNSDQGIYFHIQAGNNVWTSKPILGTTKWKSDSIIFKIPKGVQTAVIRLARARSRKIDSLVRGTLWLDSISLKGAD
jgi:tetratricopeptide (TPR) repeat protein